MAKKAASKRNPVAKALKVQKPKVEPSAKAYKRKTGQAKADLKAARDE
jgi:hypothetical protein